MKALAAALVSSIVAILVAGLGLWMVPAESRDGLWKPEPGTSWQWQLSGNRVDLSYNVDVYDIDGFDNSARTVRKIHDRGAKAICYVSVGSLENWRPDRERFPRSVIGARYDGWAGERWLDIRKIGKLAPIMRDRLDMCARKGFDAVEPDNMDGYTNETGFPLTYADQLRYNRWLAREAHRRGLSIGLKNNEGQARALVSHYDWAMTEDCFDGGWCGRMKPFANRGKAVFAAEYTDTGATRKEFCGKAGRLGFDVMLKKRNLGPWRRGC